MAPPSVTPSASTAPKKSNGKGKATAANPEASTSSSTAKGKGKSTTTAANPEASSSGSTASKRKTNETAAASKKKAKTTPAQDENAAPIIEGLPTADLDKVAIIHYNVLKVQASIATTNSETAKVQAETARLQAETSKREETTEIERGANFLRIIEMQKMLEKSGATNVNIVQVLQTAFGREIARGAYTGTVPTGSSGIAVANTSTGLVGAQQMFMQPGGGYMMPVMMNGANGPQMWMNPQGGQPS